MENTNTFFCLLFLFISFGARAQSFSFSDTKDDLTILYSKQAPKLDSIASELLASDIEGVVGKRPKVGNDVADVTGNVIVVGNIRSDLVEKFIGRQSLLHKNLTNKWECFAFKVIDRPINKVDKAFIIAGSDARGTAYGVFTLSEKLGVSPWYWWADVPAKQQSKLVIQQPDYISSEPSIKYRGIFINDEDWGLQPWAAKTFEPETGDIGPKTYAKVFELLLRLKANLIWPAMHPSTKAFFHYPKNVTTAENYQIIIGSSHAEPMLRNNVSEWDTKTMGPFNYFTNKERIYKYWEDRVKESRGINAIYSLGMRGVHDGQMEGIKDLKEAVPVVEQIIKEERDLLSKYINKNVTAIPQVLTPYKEVLEIYDHGLKVPDDVTLVWPDDNYGYIHRLNNEKEAARKGGSGVYYHASYWGRPHDYLWLSSTHPSLIREEMMKAFDNGSNRLWVLNVGDIKPLEYNIQMFMDMAYNAVPFKDSRHTKQHLLQWTTSIFGKEKGKEMQTVLWEYYQLGFERKPEFMGWSQTEPTTQTKYTEYNHFYFGDEAQKRINRYDALEAVVKKMRPQIEAERADAFYQLVYYTVVGASWINKKFLYKDKAFFYSKQNRLSAHDYALWSSGAYDSIVKETEYFNTQLAKGKWNEIMSMSPRDLPVYQKPVLPKINVDGTNTWTVAPEGYVTKDSSLTTTNGSLLLPCFDNLNNRKYFIDVFLNRSTSIQWTASVSHDWIKLSKNEGQLRPEIGEKEMRIWIDIDWGKLSKTEASGQIIFSVGSKHVSVNVQARKIENAELVKDKGFVEDNGMVVMQAAHFTKKTNRSLIRWELIHDLGYTGDAIQAFPLALNVKPSIDLDFIKRKSSVVEYDFVTFSSAVKTAVTVFALPTHPINNNYSVRYAVSIDDGPLKLVDIKTIGRSEEWKQNVLRNRAERKIGMPHLNAGKHILKLYCIDPGVILDEIRIDLGAAIRAYSTLPETIPAVK